MPRTLLHIGYPKTATNWFVHQFYPNISNAEIVYNSDLDYSIDTQDEFFRIKKEKIVLEKELLVLVTHAFTGLVDGNWKEGKYRYFFLRQLKRAYHDAEIIIFLRNQVEFILSLYSSYLKRGWTHRIDKLFAVDPPNDGNTVPFEFLNYHKFIRLYQDAFGKENVHVFLFEDLLEDNRLFLNNFTERFNMKIDINGLSYIKENERLRSGLASFVRHTNMLISRGPQPKKNFINLPFIYSIINKRIDVLNAFSIFGKKMNCEKMYEREFLDIIYSYYKKSNNDLGIESGLDVKLKKNGYPL